jgi:hypothetical protein
MEIGTGGARIFSFHGGFHVFDEAHDGWRKSEEPEGNYWTRRGIKGKSLINLKLRRLSKKQASKDFNWLPWIFKLIFTVYKMW